VLPLELPGLAIGGTGAVIGFLEGSVGLGHGKILIREKGNVS
jgi:hypothetical protein